MRTGWWCRQDKQKAAEDSSSQEEAGGRKVLKNPTLSVLEKKYMKAALEKQRKNITKKQVVWGKEFTGVAFLPKPAKILFKDFEVGKVFSKCGRTPSQPQLALLTASPPGRPCGQRTNASHRPCPRLRPCTAHCSVLSDRQAQRCKITLTNVSYTFNTFRVLDLPDDIKDFFVIKYTRPGRMSAGVTCVITITFKPKIYEDIETTLPMMAHTGPFEIPLLCYSKKAKPVISEKVCASSGAACLRRAHVSSLQRIRVHTPAV